MERYKYAQCRTFGHAWRPTRVEVTGTTRHRLYIQHLECRTCDTLKSVLIDQAGFIQNSSYSYPNDYQLPGRNTVDRNAQMRRLYLDGLH